MVRTQSNPEVRWLFRAVDPVDAVTKDLPGELLRVQPGTAIQAKGAAKSLLDPALPTEFPEGALDRRERPFATIELDRLADAAPLFHGVPRRFPRPAHKRGQIRRKARFAGVHIEVLGKAIRQFLQLVEGRPRELQEGGQVSALGVLPVHGGKEFHQACLEGLRHDQVARFMTRSSAPNWGISPGRRMTSVAGSRSRT